MIYIEREMKENSKELIQNNNQRRLRAINLQVAIEKYRYIVNKQFNWYFGVQIIFLSTVD